MRAIFRISGEGSLEELFMLWNDSPWRRKRDVLSVLNNLADRLEAEWNESERIRIAAEHEAKVARVAAQRDRLDGEVKRLSKEVQTLEAKVAELEEQNGILKRLTTAATLRADRRTLQELSDELNIRYEKIEALSKVGA